jgi:MFS family permease
MSAPFYAAALLSLTSIICTATLLPHQEPVHLAQGTPLTAGKRLGVLQFGRYAEYFKRPILNGLLAEFFLYLFSLSMFVSGFALFSERRYSYEGHPFGPREIGMLFTLSGIVGIVIQGGLLGRLVSRFGEAKLILVGIVLLGTGYFLLPHVDPVLPLAGATVLAAAGNAMLRPNLTSLVTQVAKPEEQGTLLGLTQSLASLANLTAPALSGFLIDHAALAAWGYVAGGFCCAAFLMRFFGSAHLPNIHRKEATQHSGE